MKLFYRKHYKKIVTQLSNLSVPLLSEAKQAELKSKIMANISQVPQITETPISNSRFSWQGSRLSYATYALASVAIIVVSTGTAQAASFAQPGDILYPAKLLGEALQLGITIRDEQRAEIQTQIAERRLEETQNLWVYTVEIPAQPAESTTDQTTQQTAPEAHNSDKPGNGPASNPQPARKLTAEEAKAETERSQARFQEALQALKATQTKLETKGNQRAAEAVKANIQRLESKAQQSTRGSSK